MSDIDLDTYMPNARVLIADGSGNITGAVASKKHLLITLDDTAPNDMPRYDSGDDADVRRMLFALLHVIHRNYTALPSEDQPTQMRVTSPSVISSSTGVVTRAYNFRFSTDVSAEEVIAEPS